MKSFILHLSDSHLKATDLNWCENATEKIVSALSLSSSKDALLLICFTGDISNHGSEAEFNIIKNWIISLREKLSPHYHKIEFVSVPGNHDCDLSEKDEIRDAIIEKLSNEGSKIVTDKFINLCISTQKNYFSFLAETEEHLSPITPYVFWSKSIVFQEKKISINCFNSAWLSTIDESENRYGKLIFPILEENILSKGDIVISLIHHPYNWFQPGNMQELQTLIEGNSDIILSGHEHFNKAENKQSFDDYKNLIVASKETKDTYGNLFFSLIELNMDTLEYSVNIYEKGTLVHKMLKGSVRVNNKLRFKYPLSDEIFKWLNELPSEINHHKKDKLFLSDIYVWPRINKIEIKENVESEAIRHDQYLELFSSNGVRFLLGNQYSGKTCFAKSLFKKFNQNKKLVVLINADELMSRHQDNDRFVSFISEKIASSYKEVLFEQTTFEDRVLLIDSVSIDNISYGLLNKILSIAAERFYSVVVICDETFKLAELGEGNFISYDQYELLKLSSHEIIALIDKWLLAGQSSSVDDNHDYYIKYYMGLLRQAIENNLIPHSPFYMTLYLNHAIAMGGDDISSSIALIDKMVSLRHSTISLAWLGIGGVTNLLSELAFKIYQNEGKFLSKTNFNLFFQHYCKEYKIIIENSEVLEVFVKQSVLSLNEDKVSFKDSYVYYYYLGKYLAIYQNTLSEASAALENMINKCYREDYSNIVVFASFFSSDSYVFEKVRIESKKILEEVPSTSLGADIESLVKKLGVQVSRLTYDLKSDHKENLAEIADQQMLINSTNKEVNEEAAEGNLIAKAFRYIQVLGMMAKNRTGNIKGEVKEQTIKEVIELSSRLISYILVSVDDKIDDVLPELVDRIVKKSKKPLEKQEIENKVKSIIFQSLQFFVLTITERVSFYSGASTLKIIFQDLEKNNPNNFYKLCNMQVSLDYSREPELSKLEKYSAESSGNIFVNGVMSHMVYKYLLTTRLSQNLKQTICTSFKIKIKQVNLLSEKQKEQS